jgi:hypothetical protein
MSDTFTNLLFTDFTTTGATVETAILALLLCFCIGHVVAWVYMWTHEGLSYSRMFTMSLLAMPVIVALVMMLMAGNIVIAVGLLAVFTVVRFRNVLKDTRDTTFVLWSIVEGMAAGTMRFGIALLGVVVVSLVFAYLRMTAFGGRHRYDVVVNLQWRGNSDSLDTLQPILWRHTVRAQLAGHRLLDDRQDLSYRLSLRDPSRAGDLLSDLRGTTGVSGVHLYRREDESEV